MIIREITNIRCAPQGMFRVVGYDRFERSDYLVNDFGTQAEAEAAAQQQSATPNADPTSFSDQFFVFDDRGACLKKFAYSEATTRGA